MTWREIRLSLQLAADARAGFVMRERQRAQLAIEDAASSSLRRMAQE